MKDGESIVTCEECGFFRSSEAGVKCESCEQTRKWLERKKEGKNGKRSHTRRVKDMVKKE